MITQGRMTYDLRRLRLHGMIERIPKTHRYRVTDFGLRAALYFTRVHARLYRPGIAQSLPNAPPIRSSLQEPSTSSRPKSMSRSERPNWPPENLTHLHQVPKVKTSSPDPHNAEGPD